MSGLCLEVQPCYSLQDRATGKDIATEERFAGARIITGQGRKIGTKERQDPGQSGGREERSSQKTSLNLTQEQRRGGAVKSNDLGFLLDVRKNYIHTHNFCKDREIRYQNHTPRDKESTR